MTAGADAWATRAHYILHGDPSKGPPLGVLHVPCARRYVAVWRGGRRA